MCDNQYWINKYPFLKINDNISWFAFIPDVWVESFGYQMCDELTNALGKFIDDFIIIQMKEKYGTLRVYWRFKDWFSDDREYTVFEAEKISAIAIKVQNIIDKYEDISSIINV